MKVKALKSFYVQRLKSVVTAGQEFETSKSHGDELITMGMAVFVAESEVNEEANLSDYEQALIEKHTQELQEQIAIKSGEVITLTNDLTERDAKITALEAEIESLKEVDDVSTANTDEEAPKPAKGKKA